MKTQIRIKAGQVSVLAELFNTSAAQAILKTLPFSGEVNTWGEEIYFGIPLEFEMEKGQTMVNPGDLGYWPPGKAFCVFFGPTPISNTDEIRPASAVEVFGRLIGDPAVFKTVEDGEPIVIERA
ncbi:cyclophilin-like fold protein [Chloroflexota bacterium]